MDNYTSDVPTMMPKALWAGGEQLEFKAAGSSGADDVKMFDDKTSVKAPSYISVTAPGTGPQNVPLNTDVTVSWMNGSDGTVQVIASGTSADAAYDNATVLCTGPASAGSLKVPSSLMTGNIKAGGGTFLVENAGVGTVTAGNYSIQIIAMSPPTDSTGTLFSMTPTFQ